MIERAFDEALHPRGKGAQGGQFVAKGASGANDTVGYDSKRGTGAGYGKKGGDGRVSELQKLLNNLGFTDSNGQPLKVDGKLGPKTTAAIKRLQRKMGLKSDGLVTPQLLKTLRQADHRRHVAYKSGGKRTRQAAQTSLAKKPAPAQKTAAPAQKATTRKATPARKARR